MTIKILLQTTLLGTCIGWAGYGAFFSPTGIIKHRHIMAEIATEKTACDALSDTIKSLKQTIATIKKNSFELEKLAREDLHMSCTNEYVYLLKSEV